MPYIELPLGVKVAMEYEQFGKVVVNVYHITTTDPIITVKLFDIADVFRDWWINTGSVGLSESIALHAVTAHDLSVPNGEKVTRVVSPAVPGGAAGEAASNNVALVVSFATAQTGRSFRGRAYLAGIRDADIAGNNVTEPLAAGIVSYFVELLIDLITKDCRLVVASFANGGVPREVGVATAVESIAVNTRVDTQRRRLPVS